MKQNRSFVNQLHLDVSTNDRKDLFQLYDQERATKNYIGIKEHYGNAKDLKTGGAAFYFTLEGLHDASSHIQKEFAFSGSWVHTLNEVENITVDFYKYHF